MNRRIYLILLLFPLFFFTLEWMFKADYSYYYMSVYDPAYVYLLNGLNLANLNIIGHVDHPGTPLQILISIVIRITYLFRNNNTLIEDVFLNPELYLNNISFTLISINTIAIFLTGCIIYHIFRNLPGAIFIQLSVFLSNSAMFFLSVVMVEPLLVFTELVMIMFIFQYIYKNNRKFLNKYIIAFAIVSGFGIANKIVFFPIILIPFMLLKGIKSRVKFILILVISFLIFILPAIGRFKYFILWIKSLIIYAGKFGQGEPTVININEFIQNLINIFKDEYVFTIAYILIIITIGLYLRRRYRILLKENKYYKLLVIIFITITIQIIIVAKHYSHHYMIPAHILIATSVFLIVLIVKKLGINAFTFIPKKLLTFIVIFLGFLLIFRLIIYYHFPPNLVNPRKNTVDFLEKNLCNKARIIVNNKHAESAFVESALYFGMCYAHDQKYFYGKILKKRFPDTYFYNINSHEFHDWQSTFPAFDIATRYSKIWLYFIRKDNILLQEIIRKFSDISYNNSEVVKIKEIYINNNTSEVIYELSFDNNIIKSSIKVMREIRCNCEIIDNNYFISSEGEYYFENGNLQNNEIYFNGKHSIKLTEKYPYGLGIKIYIKHGSTYKINVWRFSRKASGIIVATTDVTSEFYKTGASIQETRGDWERIELNVVVPESLLSDSLYIYVWNNLKESEVYFDDFIIRQTELKK